MTQTSPSSIDAAIADSLTNGQLAIVTVGRLALITAFRIIYPLQPFLALHLGVDLRTISALVTIQALVSAVSPLGGVLADTRGERWTMSLGLALFCGGALLCASSATFAAFLVGYGVIGLAMAFYQPAAQGYLSARTSYARRAWSLGVLETSWAGAAIIGVAPLMQVVQATGDSTPVFWVLLVVGAASLLLISFTLPATPRRGRPGGQSIQWGALRSASVLAALLIVGLALCAYNTFVVVHGAWIKATFAADEGALGRLFAMVGVGELIGSAGVALIADRVGKRRSVVIGFALAIACMLALPFTAGSWAWFLALFFGYYMLQEFALVATLPLISGVAPAARATVLALSVATTGLGSVLGSQISEPLWSGFGLFANAAAASAMLVAALLCLPLVREVDE